MSQPNRARPKRSRAVLSADRILNSASPIATLDLDLLELFQNCVANWATLYSENEKAAIIATMPTLYQRYDRDESGQLICPLTVDFVLGDHVFRDNVPRFQRDVKEGYWTATWRKNAIKASEERARGVFDEYLREHAEDAFGNAGDDGDGVNNDDEVGDQSSDGEYRAKKSARSDKKGRRNRKDRTKEKQGRADRMGMEAALHGMDE